MNKQKKKQNAKKDKETKPEWVEMDWLELSEDEELLDEIAEEFMDDPETAVERAEELGYGVEDLIDRI